MAGYAEVLETVFGNADVIEPTENHIKQLNRDLLIYGHKDERHRGQYKTNPNNVGAFDVDGNEIGVVFETASPFDTPRLMSELVDWTREALEQKKLHPLLIVDTTRSLVFVPCCQENKPPWILVG